MNTLKWTVFMLLAAMVIAPAAAGETEIEFFESAVVNSPTVTLGDIASILPDTQENRDLAGYELQPAPGVGRLATLRAEDLKRSLTRQEIVPKDTKWDGARRIQVSRAGVTIDTPEIQAILDSYINRNRSLLPEAAQVSFRNIRLGRPFQLPQGDLAVEVIPADPAILKNQRFTLIFRVNGKVVENLAVFGKPEIIAPVVVAKTDIERGVIITEQDISLVPMDLTRVHNPCFDPQELIGKVASRSLRQGIPVDSKTVDTPVIIHRGERVRIILQNGLLQLTATGIAGHDAKQDSTIRVMNINSRKEIFCKVIAPGYVAVEL